jgi:hypothetical protein
MNLFLKSTKQLINQHGLLATFTAITEGVYNPNTLSTSNTSTDYAVTVFKNHIKTSQYNYPNLIGKEVAEFYLANDSLTFVPSNRDLVTYSGTVFTIENIQEHHAMGSVALYTIIASKG